MEETQDASGDVFSQPSNHFILATNQFCIYPHSLQDICNNKLGCQRCQSIIYFAEICVQGATKRRVKGWEIITRKQEMKSQPGAHLAVSGALYLKISYGR